MCIQFASPQTELWTQSVNAINAHSMHIEFGSSVQCEKAFKVTGYHEWVWFKNNFAKVFFACNYYAGVTTTSNAVSFRSLWNK